MSKAKFKVGYTVRVLDGSDIVNYVGCFTPSMRDRIGEVFTVNSVEEKSEGRYGYRFKETGYIWDERGLELAYPKRKFKLGDKVVCTVSSPYGTSIRKGTKGEVTYVEPTSYVGDSYFKVKFEGERFGYWMRDDDVDFYTEPKAPFKVGDYIKGTNTRYGITNSNMILAQVVKANTLSDRMDIKCLKFENSYKTDTVFNVANDTTLFALTDVSKYQRIEIYVDGADVIAKNILTGKTAKATCHKDDVFDFNIGAKLAFERLMNPIVKQDSYKVGDKVKIVDEWNDSTCQNCEGRMDKYLGTVMTIREITKSGKYKMEEDKDDRPYTNGWLWNKHCIEGKVVGDCSEFKKPEVKKEEPKKPEPKFKEGDIVELVESIGDLPKGVRGTIIAIDWDADLMVDFHFKYGYSTHTLGGRLPEKTGRYLVESQVKKVDA